MQRWLWADWTLHPWRHNSSNVGGDLQARRDTTKVMLGVSLRARCDTTLVFVIIVDKMVSIQCYLLLSREDNTMRLSSSIVTISWVSVPFNSSSPLVLKLPKLNTCTRQSLITTESLASISFSLTADMHVSYKIGQTWQKNNNNNQSQKGLCKEKKSKNPSLVGSGWVGLGLTRNIFF